jgi:intein-encoded DNA endonuclease-like protein
MEAQIVYVRKLPLTERLSLYEKAKSLHRKGFNLSEVSRILGIKQSTVEYWIGRGGKPGRELEPKIKVDKTKVKEIAYLAGVVHSDGWLTRYKRTYYITLQTTDEDFALEFKRAIKAVTGRDVKIYRKKRRWHIRNGVVFIDKKTPLVVQICSRELYEILSNPEEFIAKSPEDYIRGFADGDGTIFRDNDKYSRIRLYNKNLERLERIRELLSKIGIDSHIRAINKGALYALEISKQLAIKKFMECIGFSIRRKQEHLVKLQQVERVV